MKCWFGVMAGFAGLGMAAAMADDPDAATPDAELLEFLGSWEGQGDDWSAFVDSLPAAGEPRAVEQSASGIDDADGYDANDGRTTGERE